MDQRAKNDKKYPVLNRRTSGTLPLNSLGYTLYREHESWGKTGPVFNGTSGMTMLVYITYRK
jgi:hypothetical protein